MSVSARTYMHVDGRRTCVCTYAPTLTLKHNTRTHAQDAQSVEEARASPTEDLIGSTESVNLLISQDRDASPHESELPPERKQVCVCVCVCTRACVRAHARAFVCVPCVCPCNEMDTHTHTHARTRAHSTPLHRSRARKRQRSYPRQKHRMRIRSSLTPTTRRCIHPTGIVTLLRRPRLEGYLVLSGGIGTGGRAPVLPCQSEYLWMKPRDRGPVRSTRPTHPATGATGATGMRKVELLLE